jgi:hypothetical protein
MSIYDTLKSSNVTLINRFSDIIQNSGFKDIPILIKDNNIVNNLNLK